MVPRAYGYGSHARRRIRTRGDGTHGQVSFHPYALPTGHPDRRYGEEEDQMQDVSKAIGHEGTYDGPYPRSDSHGASIENAVDELELAFPDDDDGRASPGILRRRLAADE